jgi:hypothetical protein
MPWPGSAKQVNRCAQPERESESANPDNLGRTADATTDSHTTRA